jgi:hypothetical protein
MSIFKNVWFVACRYIFFKSVLRVKNTCAATALGDTTVDVARGDEENTD